MTNSENQDADGYTGSVWGSLGHPAFGNTYLVDDIEWWNPKDTTED